MKPIKKLSIISLFLLALFQSSNVQTLFAQEIGRFQLLNVVVEEGGVKESVLFKIDTVTGNTWRYRQVSFTTINGVPVGCDGWDPVIGDYSENFNRLMKSIESWSPKTNESTNSVLQPALLHSK